MYEGQSSNSAYRIKKKKQNYIVGQQHRIGSDEDPFKMSIHSSTQMTPGQRKRGVSQGLRYRQNKLQRSSYRSKKSSKHLTSSSITATTKKSRALNSKKIIQFDNVKWLSIISAYDPKQLKNVTTSSESYQKFLKNGDVRKDQYSKDTYKVVIDHFKCWVSRIRAGYEQILNSFLFQNTNTPAIVTLANVKPLLEQVKFESSMMHEKVKTCQRTQNYRQFSGLLLKFDTFLEASHEIEEIIYIVNESKNRIDDLFKNLEKDKEIDKKVNKERRRGIKKVRHAVKDYGHDGIQARILDKVQLAINQMADKTLEAFSKINGARGLMYRIQQCLKDKKQSYDLQNIITINQIFREVIREANQFERFADRFMDEGDILNDDLRECILKYREQVQIKKQAVFQMELVFISNIIETSIQVAQANYSVCNTIQSDLYQQYKTIQKLLNSICQIISDETKKVHVDLMLKDNKQRYRKIDYLVKKLRKYEQKNQGLQIDTKQGLAGLTNLEETIKSYKNLIKVVTERQQRTYRQITNQKIRNKQQFPSQDSEELYLKDLIKLSKTMNQSQKIAQIQNVSAITQFSSPQKFKDICEVDLSLSNMKIVRWCFQAWQKYEELSHNNQISNVLPNISLCNQLYLRSLQILEIYKISSGTNEKNILGQAQELNKYSQKLDSEISINFLERALYQLLYLGLQKRMIKLIQNPESLVFPTTQHDIQSLKRDIKYMNHINRRLPQKNPIKNDTFECCKQLSALTTALKQIIEGASIYQSIKWNKQQIFYLDHRTVFGNIQLIFKLTFMQRNSFLIGENVSTLVQKLQKCQQTLEKLKKNEQQSTYHPARIHHILTIINFYIKVNQKLLDSLSDLVESSHEDWLNIYSKIVLHCSVYLHETKQSCHLVLNNSIDKNPIWICEEGKENSLGMMLGLNNLGKGVFLKKYEERSCLAHRRPPSAINKSIKEKQQKKKKKDEIDDEMEEYIQDDDEMGDEMDDEMGDQIDQMGDEMDDEMGDQIDQMGDEMGDEIVDDMEDEMGDEMGDEIGDNMEDMLDEGDNIDDQMQDQLQDKGKNKKNPQTSTTKQQPQQQPKQSAQQSHKSPQKEEAQEYNSVIIIPKTFVITYEAFTLPIKNLDDLCDLVTKLKDLYAMFWNHTSLKKIQDYFNRQYEGEINKELIEELQRYCREIFNKQVINSKTLHTLQSYKKIVNSVHQIDSYKIEELENIMKVNRSGKKFSKLLGNKKQLLRVSIQQGQEWRASYVVTQYLSGILKLINIENDNFDAARYRKKLLKLRKSNCQTNYQIISDQLQPQHLSLSKTIALVEKCCSQYNSLEEFPDNINLPQTIITLWNNSISQYQTISMAISDKLKSDICLLKQAIDQQNFSAYIVSLNQQSSEKYQFLIDHRSKLEQIYSASTNCDDLLDNIRKLIEIYKCTQKEGVIYLDKQPIIIKDKQSTQIHKLLNKLLLPVKGHNITSQNIHLNIKQVPQLYAIHHKPITKILSILGIESHIWVSQTNLQIFTTKQEIFNCIISQVTDRIVRSIEDLDHQSHKVIYQAATSKEQSSLVWEYMLKDGSCLDPQSNRKYLTSLNNLKKAQKKLCKIPQSIGLCIYESAIEPSDENNNTYTQLVLEIIQQLEDILTNNHLFNDKAAQISIFKYYQQYNQDIDKIKSKLSKLKESLEAIVEPLDLSDKGIMKENFRKRNQVVVEIYREFMAIQQNQLRVLSVCLCEDDGDCEANRNVTQIYVNNKKKGNLIEDILAKIFIEPSQIYLNFFQQQTKTYNSEQFDQQQILHAGQLLKNLRQQLVFDNRENFKRFMNEYNYKHFVNLDHSLAMTEYKAISQMETKKNQILRVLDEFFRAMKENSLFYGAILSAVGYSGAKQIQEEFQKSNTHIQCFNDIDMSTIAKFGKYNNYGKWVVEVIGKHYKIPTVILMDNVEQNIMVCLMPQLEENQLLVQLNRLKLPSEYQVIEEKKSFTKIKLKSQLIKYKLGTQVSSQEIVELVQDDYGIKDKQKMWVLAVYRIYTGEDNEKEQALINWAQLDQRSLDQTVVQLSISSQEISGQLQFRIIQAKNRSNQEQQSIENSFKRILLSEKQRLYLGELVQLDKIGKWLKKEIERLKQIKEARFILEQKQKEEQQRKKEEERARKQREEEERARKQREEEQRARKQREEQNQRRQLQGNNSHQDNANNNSSPHDSPQKKTSENQYVPH